MSTIESRLVSIEEAILGQSGGYKYSDQATLDATNSGNTINLSANSGKTYVIQDGDTLGSIARKHGVERSDLLSSNRLSEGQPIYIGETLVIPGEAPKTAPAPAADTTKIAEAPKPAPAKKDAVVVGDTKAPAPKSTPEKSDKKVHIVAKGDTLMGISRQYKVDVNSLKAANGLRTDVIGLGQKITIPIGSSVASNTTTPPKTDTNQETQYEYENPLLSKGETYGYYTVNKGDNLYALARDFFTSMAELQRVNRLGAKTLFFPGDELIVPTSKYNAYHQNGDVAQR
ncbi:MAG: LysM peptidoglycan-binding domain-containing protein [Verrucomicrobiales bacterium]|nr:LysM peptidoglycan-binding domain-containing protein [Verrucomicrobiales bacterium]